jgi:hypothetical protein
MDVYARRRLVAVLAIVLVLVLIGVAIAGGGDDEAEPTITTVTGASSPGTTTALSKDEFISEADDICEESAVAIENLSTDDPEQLARQELATTEGQLDSLRSLAPPDEDQDQLDDFFAALEDLVDALDTRALALERGDDTAASEAETDISTAQSELADAADAYGFEECGGAAEAGSEADAETDAGAAPTDTGTAAPVAPAPSTTPAPAPAPAPAPSDSGGTGSGGGGTGTGGTGGGGSDSGGVSP